MKLSSLLPAGLCALGLVAAPVSAAGYSSLFVFGDSLVDPGNAQIASAVLGLPDPAPAATGYRFGRFSNGGNFADYLNLALTGTPSVPALAGTGGLNFGVGGATTVSNPVIPPIPPGFQQELDFAASVPFIPGDALVLVTFGGNDIRRLIGTGDPFDIVGIKAAMALGLNDLADKGARHIMVTGLPDIGLLPSTLAFGVGESVLATQRSLDLNIAFIDAVATVGADRGIDLRYFDLFGLDHAVRAMPTAFGLPAAFTTGHSCQSDGPAAVIAGCDGYLYFDAIHPTTQVHAVIAGAIFGQLGPVPEPATWALMIAGLGLAGAAMRRRTVSVRFEVRS